MRFHHSFGISVTLTDSYPGLLAIPHFASFDKELTNSSFLSPDFSSVGHPYLGLRYRYQQAIFGYRGIGIIGTHPVDKPYSKETVIRC